MLCTLVPTVCGAFCGRYAEHQSNFGLPKNMQITSSRVLCTLAASVAISLLVLLLSKVEEPSLVIKTVPMPSAMHSKQSNTEKIEVPNYLFYNAMYKTGSQTMRYLFEKAWSNRTNKLIYMKTHKSGHRHLNSSEVVKQCQIMVTQTLKLVLF